jgi:hypothetical protein|tara:strand:- start:14 stop:172 length:159 start_codon:yes stop_codon:yes gene_type:complete
LLKAVGFSIAPNNTINEVQKIINYGYKKWWRRQFKRNYRFNTKKQKITNFIK